MHMTPGQCASDGPIAPVVSAPARIRVALIGWMNTHEIQNAYSHACSRHCSAAGRIVRNAVDMIGLERVASMPFLPEGVAVEANTVVKLWRLYIGRNNGSKLGVTVLQTDVYHNFSSPWHLIALRCMIFWVLLVTSSKLEEYVCFLK